MRLIQWSYHLIGGLVLKETIFLVVVGYALGNIPFSYIVAQKMGHVDIRQHGSGNTGATNVYRVLGIKAGIWAFAGDFIKGLTATLIGRAIMGTEGAALCGSMAMLGHCYPAAMGFKGGKGVATSGGMVFGLNPMIGVILLPLMLGIIKTTGYVSLASVICAGLFPIMTLLFNMPLNVTLYALFVALLIIYRHRSNIDRLIKGEESKVSKNKK